MENQKSILFELVKVLKNEFDPSTPTPLPTYWLLSSFTQSVEKQGRTALESWTSNHQVKPPLTITIFAAVKTFDANFDNIVYVENSTGTQ